MRRWKITNRRHQGMLLSVTRQGKVTHVPIRGRRVTEVAADDLNWNQITVMRNRGYVEVEELTGARGPVTDSASSATSVKKEPPAAPQTTAESRSAEPTGNGTTDHDGE